MDHVMLYVITDDDGAEVVHVHSDPGDLDAPVGIEIPGTDACAWMTRNQANAFQRKVRQAIGFHDQYINSGWEPWSSKWTNEE